MKKRSWRVAHTLLLSSAISRPERRLAAELVESRGSHGQGSLGRGLLLRQPLPAVFDETARRPQKVK